MKGDFVLAKETTYERQVREALEALPSIVAATQVEPGYMFTNFKVHSYLVSEGLVEVKEDLQNEAGDEATRATQKGINLVTEHVYCSENPINEGNEKVMSETVNETAAVVNEFAIVDIPVVRTRLSGGRKSSYPFDKLAVGQSFFVVGAVAKKLASTVCNAMKKFDVPLLDEAGVQKTKEITVPKTGEKRIIPAMAHTVKFTCVDIADGTAYGHAGKSGVAIGRTA